MKQGDMSISAFSRRSLLSVKALRLYDEMGMLRPQHVDPVSKYRYYSESQLETARLISLLRKLELPLSDVAAIINQSPTDASQTLDTWWRKEMSRLAGRSDLLRYIRGSVLGHDLGDTSGSEGYSVTVRHVPAQTYLYQSRHLHGPELPRFISESTEQLLERSNEYGGPRGPISVMFHGQVDLDSDGPVDVCLPVGSGAVATGADLIRTESAHMQAFTELRSFQLEFPQILQVYQWLRHWIEVNGYSLSGLPREIYVGDYHADMSHETVCEIAYPVQTTKGPRT